jgi:hypothetical protein
MNYSSTETCHLTITRQSMHDDQRTQYRKILDRRPTISKRWDRLYVYREHMGGIRDNSAVALLMIRGILLS